MIVVISSCSATKDDSIPIPENGRRVFPAEYLGDASLIRRLEKTREEIFKDSRSEVGKKSTYAFDLYVPAGKAYRHLVPSYRAELKQMMVSNKLSWFFLSGGYGIIHALEPAKKYQATFNRGIARQNDIPFTVKQWTGILGDLIDSAVSKLNPEWIFFFGSQDYSAFFKESRVWLSDRNVRLFESTGSAGPSWLSPIIGKLGKSIVEGKLERFNSNLDRFTKQ